MAFNNTLNHFLYFLLLTFLTSCGGGGSNGSSNNNNGSSDTTIPVITLIGDSSINLSTGDTYSDAGASATDDTDGDISTNIIVAGDNVNSNVVGNYTITYNVSDNAGNHAAQIIRTITVSNSSSNSLTHFIAYKLEDLSSNIDNIYLVRGNGSDHRDLHLSIPSGGEVISYSWGPSANSRIAYLGDVDTDTVNELYTFDPNLNSRAKINNVLPSGGHVIEFKWSPDGSKIAYRANQDEFGKIELYVADPDGQNRVKVNTTLVSEGNVEEFTWSPASSHILYRADDSVNDHFNWHVASNDGVSSNQVNVNYSASESITSVNWSPLGGYIDYIHDLVGNADVDLYIYKIPDSSNTKYATFAFANTQIYEWSINEEFFAIGIQFGGVDIHSLNGNPIANIPNIDFFNFIPSSNNLIAFRTNVLSSTNREYLVSTYDSAGNVINAESSYLTGNYYGLPESLKFSPDSSNVIINFDGNTGIADTLFIYNFNDSSSINLHIASGSNPEVDEVSWSEDSSRLLIINGFSDKLIISPNGSGLVDLVSSTSASATSVLYYEQWLNNTIYLVRGTGISPVSDDILTLDSVGQNLNVIKNSDSTHAFYCGDSYCNNETPSFKVSNDGNSMVYRRVAEPSLTESDDLHALNIDGSGDVTISIDFTSPLYQRISEFSIQPVI